MQNTVIEYSSQLQESEALLLELYRSFLHHGYGDITIKCSTVHNNRRRVLIKAGKIFLFLIEESEVKKQ